MKYTESFTALVGEKIPSLMRESSESLEVIKSFIQLISGVRGDCKSLLRTVVFLSVLLTGLGCASEMGTNKPLKPFPGKKSKKEVLDGMEGVKVKHEDLDIGKLKLTRSGVGKPTMVKNVYVLNIIHIEEAVGKPTMVKNVCVSNSGRWVTGPVNLSGSKNFNFLHTDIRVPKDKRMVMVLNNFSKELNSFNVKIYAELEKVKEKKFEYPELPNGALEYLKKHYSQEKLKQILYLVQQYFSVKDFVPPKGSEKCVFTVGNVHSNPKSQAVSSILIELLSKKDDIVLIEAVQAGIKVEQKMYTRTCNFKHNVEVFGWDDMIYHKKSVEDVREMLKLRKQMLKEKDRLKKYLLAKQFWKLKYRIDKEYIPKRDQSLRRVLAEKRKECKKGKNIIVLGGQSHFGFPGPKMTFYPQKHLDDTFESMEKYFKEKK